MYIRLLMNINPSDIWYSSKGTTLYYLCLVYKALIISYASLSSLSALMISLSFWVDMADRANFSKGINACMGQK